MVPLSTNEVSTFFTGENGANIPLFVITLSKSFTGVNIAKRFRGWDYIFSSKTDEN